MPLEEELAVVRAYLDIEALRLGDRLKVEQTIDPHLSQVVMPPFSLQPLVENCIKHGLASKIEGGSITLRSRIIKSRLVVEVEDNGVGMGAAQLLARPDGVGFVLNLYFQSFNVAGILAYGLTFAAIMLCAESALLQPWERRANAWRAGA